NDDERNGNHRMSKNNAHKRIRKADGSEGEISSDREDDRRQHDRQNEKARDKPLERKSIARKPQRGKCSQRGREHRRCRTHNKSISKCQNPFRTEKKVLVPAKRIPRYRILKILARGK